MRPEKYGMYYWYDYKDKEKESYRILMMLTEKSIGGRNYNIFLKTLFDLDKSLDFSIGEYAFSGDGDKLISEKYHVYITCEDNQFSVYNNMTNELLWQTEIPQENKVDSEDRIEIGLRVMDKIKDGQIA